ncbi:hypothetical protein CDAR_203931 [Caerostris darwini]|uniref:Uncharacterized protein n=1 Tax=Caerostris darwini TaxID=1538125 RepID=A0AAV4RRF8_9ARAC|nr:hypothetical protein CDAR_203931 [Caerostris darwini]
MHIKFCSLGCRGCARRWKLGENHLNNIALFKSDCLASIQIKCTRYLAAFRACAAKQSFLPPHSSQICSTERFNDENDKVHAAEKLSKP